MPATKEQDTSVQYPQLAAVRPPFQPQKTKKPRVSFNKLMQSSYFRIGLTFFLLILLFLTASFIAFQSEQKRKKLKDYEKPIPDAEIIVPEGETGIIDDETLPGWKTYANEEIGISFIYPENLELSNRGSGPHESVIDSIDFRRRDKVFEYNLTIYSIDSTSLSDFIQSNLNILFPPDMKKVSSLEVASTTVNKYQYSEATPSLPTSTIYIFANQGKGFAFQVSNVTDEKESVADQILSTLRFNSGQ